MVRPGFKIHNERLSHLGENAEGAAYLEGPQGALYHRIMVKDGKIDDYQIIDASTWNASPRDENGLRGQLEEALIGTPVPDADNPINVLRVVRSFNPCLACAVHMLKIDSRK
jgi:hydrogenase large subunit